MKRLLSGLLLATLLPAGLQAATINGKVTKQGGDTAIAEATVILRQNNQPRDTATTDATGDFSFAGVAAGNYTVAVTKDGYQASNNNAANAANADTTIVLAISLSPIPPPGTVAGVIRKLPDSSLAAGATVILRRTTGGGAGTVVFADTATTNAGGEYSFADVPVATGYSVVSSLAGYLNRTTNNVAVTTAATTTVNQALEPIPPPGAVSGVIRKLPDSSAASGATVILRRTTGGGAGTVAFADTTTADADGKYAFADVPVNTGYSVVASLAGHVNGTVNNIAITAAATDTVNIVLAPIPDPGKVAGTVTKVSDASPVAGATVILRRTTGGGAGTVAFVDTLTTNAQGKFSFDSVPAANGYTLIVSAASLDTVTKTGIGVASDSTTTVDVAMAAPGTPGKVAGVIRKLPDSSVVAGATVILRRTQGGGQGGGTVLFADTVVTGADGKYSFDSVPPATNYVLTASFTGLNTGTVNNVGVSAGVTATVNVILAPPAVGTLVVYVGLDSAGNPPLAGAALVAISGNRELADTTGASGYAVLADILTGNYTVTATLAGYVAKAATRAVSQNGSDTLRINLARVTDSNTKVLSGVVRDADSAVIAGATVTFRSGGGAGAAAITLEVTTDAEGKYSIAAIPNTVNSGTLIISKEGFNTQTINNVSLAAAANTRNVTLIKPTSIWSSLGSRSALRSKALRPGIFIMPNGGKVRLDAMGRRLPMP